MEGKEEFLHEGFREWKNGDESGQDFPFTVLSCLPRLQIQCPGAPKQGKGR